MLDNFQGIPNLPDLTHPEELINLGKEIINYSLILTLILIGLGFGLAVINFSLKGNQFASGMMINKSVSDYNKLLKIWQHSILILIIMVNGFFVASTLANRYHTWEQQKIAKIANTVTGERLEQVAPTVRYVVEKPITYNQYIDGKFVKVEDISRENRYLPLNSSNIEVTIDQVTSPQDNRNQYLIDFKGEYQVTNTLENNTEFWLEIYPPYNYSLLRNFRVEKNGKKIEPKNQGEYNFPLNLAQGETIKFTITYQAQGNPRWVYNAGSQIISNFSLTAKTTFSNADFASGIIPTETKQQGKEKIFTWIFQENVSVSNPFGVFTATEKITGTGILPRLLILSPILLLWWLLLLYLSLPSLSVKNVVLVSGIFFASIFALTYISKLLASQIVWLVIAIFMLVLVKGLEKKSLSSVAVIICTITGAILPVFGLLISYSGLTLSIAVLLSIFWLAIKNWYLKVE